MYDCVFIQYHREVDVVNTNVTWHMFSRVIITTKKQSKGGKRSILSDFTTTGLGTN